MAAASTLDARIARLHPELVGFLRRRAPGMEEELAQEVWLRLVKAAPDIATDESFRAYCFLAARRVLVDFHRRRGARIQLVPSDDVDRSPSAEPSPDAALRARAVHDVVEAELALMKPEIAEVFVERTTGSASFREIAERQGVPLNTALGRMHRATQRIAAALRARDLLGDSA